MCESICWSVILLTTPNTAGHGSIPATIGSLKIIYNMVSMMIMTSTNQNTHSSVVAGCCSTNGNLSLIIVNTLSVPIGYNTMIQW